jgi:hypothetical protein
MSVISDFTGEGSERGQRKPMADPMVLEVFSDYV